jgi:nucleosome binding factor SPN SPT16 subunit
MLWFQKEMEKLVADEQSMKHSALAQKVEDRIVNDAAKFKIPGLQIENLDVAFHPIIMSGGKFDLKLSAQPSNDEMHSGVIIASVGVRYVSYCS